MRSDDHADDYPTHSDVVLCPGESVTAIIDSDVAPDDPGLNSWDWKVDVGAGDGVLRPRRGIEMLNDRDVYRFEIPQEGLYRVSVSDQPAGVGVWWIWDEGGELFGYAKTTPEESVVDHYLPERTTWR